MLSWLIQISTLFQRDVRFEQIFKSLNFSVFLYLCVSFWVFNDTPITRLQPAYCTVFIKSTVAQKTQLCYCFFFCWHLSFQYARAIIHCLSTVPETRLENLSPQPQSPSPHSTNQPESTSFNDWTSVNLHKPQSTTQPQWTDGLSLWPLQHHHKYCPLSTYLHPFHTLTIWIWRLSSLPVTRRTS